MHASHLYAGDIATTRDKAVYNKVWKLATGICTETCNSDKYSYIATYMNILRMVHELYPWPYVKAQILKLLNKSTQMQSSTLMQQK